MLPACRTEGEDFAIPTFDIVSSDVEGFMEELWEFQAAFHDCFARSEPRAHFFDSMVGQLSPLERKSTEPMALHVEGGTVRGLQRFISDLARTIMHRVRTHPQGITLPEVAINTPFSPQAVEAKLGNLYIDGVLEMEVTEEGKLIYKPKAS